MVGAEPECSWYSLHQACTSLWAVKWWSDTEYLPGLYLPDSISAVMKNASAGQVLAFAEA